MLSQSFVASGVGSIDAIPPVISILVVEDDPGDFGLIDAYLRQSGFWHGDDKPQVSWAKSLADGIQQAKAKRPDVVLLDLSLPDSLGIRTVEAMNAVLPDIPIVVLTGHDDNRLAIAVLEAGAQDYLVKGRFDHDGLRRAVRYALVRGKLESRLRLFEVALNSAANGIVITDINGQIQWGNPAFAQLTGFLVEEVLGLNPRELLKSGKQDQAFYRHMWETILSGQVWRGEIINRRKDGTLYDEALAIAPVVTDDGTIRHFVAIKQDITERKEAESQNRQSEQRLELALAGSDLGLWDWHIPSGKVVFNERWCSMLGYRKDEVEPDVRSWERLVHPEDWPHIHTALDAHLKGETAAYEVEHRLRHKDGHWVWVLDRGKVVIRDEEGNPLRAAGTHLDISDRKRLNFEGSQLLRRIESLIKEVSSHGGMNATQSAASQQTGEKLSARQRQVLQLVAQGRTSVQIANTLRLATGTVIAHRRDIMRKLNLHSVAELTCYAIDNDLILR